MYVYRATRNGRLFLVGVGIFLVLHCSPRFLLSRTCDLLGASFNEDLIICSFQLVKQAHRQTDGNSMPTYDDEYKTGRGSTVIIPLESCPRLF